MGMCVCVVVAVSGRPWAWAWACVGAQLREGAQPKAWPAVLAQARGGCRQHPGSREGGSKGAVGR